jgi:xanthine dehydrogenase YagR molybdenum-binding subunit
MTVVTGNKLLGDPVDRVDGPDKVTGAAPYPSDVTYPGLVHAALVQSTIAAGTIRKIDAGAAEAAPGVLAVITHENAPALAEGPVTPVLGPTPRFSLKDNRIMHHGQHVAIVVAETREQATAAARLVRIDYEETAPVLGIDNPQAAVLRNPLGPEVQRGDAAAALASADVVYDETFTMAAVTNNPLGLFATVARWEGDRLVVHEPSQWPTQARQTLATVFNVPQNNVRVLVPYVGGGFGAGLRTWPHAILTALAARLVDRPVKLVLTRPQMFTSVGHRQEANQRLRLGATREGRLVAIDHEGTATRATEDADIEPASMQTGAAYACPNVATHDRLVRLNIPVPAWLRGPGTTEGNFALESALDELSYRLRIDPIELRLRNYAEVHPQSGLAWSSNALRECYRVGAERFGWARRTAEIGSMREGNWLVGYGMAGVTFGGAQLPCQVRVSIRRDGSAHVRSAATDIGTGTYTVATQLAAALLGLDLGQVRVEIGDSDLPSAPPSGGSGLATSLGGAIHDAAGNLLRAFLSVLADDDRSPLRGRRPADVTVTDGRIHLVDDPSVGETYRDILARHQLDELTADGEINPGPQGAGMAQAGAFAARFAEVRIDPELGLLRLARIVSAVDGGRILNEKLARSQIIGATVMGIGMTMLEETIFDSGTGRIANATFGDYMIPVNADVPDLDVVFVGEPDKLNPIGSKGLGEVGIVGVSAAIANAVYHATGRRIRSLPITIDQLL